MALPSVLERVRGALEAEFGTLARLPPGLRVEGVPASSLEVRYGEPALGLYQAGVISVVDTARGASAVRIVAHEAGHAWLGGDEGAAEWVAFHVLSRLGLSTASLLNGPYGGEVRRLLALEAEGGVAEVLLHVGTKQGR